MQLEFGPNLGYLLAAYVIVVAAIAGYTGTLIARSRELDRRATASSRAR